MSTTAWNDYECDKIEEDQCYESLGNQFGFSPAELSQAISHIREKIEYDPELLSWIRGLRTEMQGPIKVIAISNIARPDYQALNSRWGPFF